MAGLPEARQERRHPEQTFRAGGISASVWKNTTKEGDKEYRNVTFERRYLDKDGQWKSTNSMHINDLPKASVVLAKTYEYLVLKEKDTVQLQEEVVA